ncbi:MAG: UDP-N-acetylmuramoyl-tripeptide--D-alanyl-D-alanine ligase [Bacteroidota bacterium]
MEQLYEIYQSCSGVTTDSRNIQPNCLFIALRGECFDGNEYAADALAKGAAYAIIDRPEYAVEGKTILVADSLKCLQQLATHHRSQLIIPVLAITGSNGKTTTKELIREVLSSRYRTHCTKGNFNNHIGLPLTLLDMPTDTEVAVIEMGANHQGEIDELCRIARPTHGIITNIGKAHLEGFGGIEGVKKGKSELYRYLAEDRGLAFVNLDEKWLKDLASPVANQLWYQKSEAPLPENPIYETQLLETHPSIRSAFMSLDGERIEVGSQLMGMYNFNNVMTAITIGRYFKVPPLSIKQAIESYEPSNNRSQILQKGSNTFVLDAYNANPSSVSQALSNFSKMEAACKIAVLGDMLELGDFSQSEHQKILQQAISHNFDDLWLVGELFEGLAEEKNSHIRYFKNTADLKKWFDQQAIENSTLLLKGSRKIALEKLLD